VLIAQAIFLLQCGHTNPHTQTHEVTDATDRPIPHINYAGVK